MLWLMQHKNIWRVAVLVLLLVAVIGPWAFDEINVPAEYTCSAPNIRLEGDFCGLPMSGTWILLMVIGHLASVVVGLVTGTAYFSESESGPLIYILNSAMLFVLAFLILLPLISTLLLILRGERRRWQVLHLVALGLAAGTGLLFGLSSLPRLYGALWGSWLYIGVTLCALVLELMMFLTAQRVQKIPNINPISSQLSHKS